ncbi:MULTISPECIES: hypothetical protein [unclassified Coprococcus]|nr:MULTISPECIES: hypothetical protein [unclassified Coprococcus]
MSDFFDTIGKRISDTDFIALCEAIEKREEQTEVCEQEIARIKGE